MNGKDEWEKKEEGDKKGEGEEVRPMPIQFWVLIYRGLASIVVAAMFGK
jgi:hypothetical protein